MTLDPLPAPPTPACPWTRKVPVRGGWAVLAFCVATVAGGPAAKVLEGQRSGHGTPGSEACTFAFGGPRHPFRHPPWPVCPPAWSAAVWPGSVRPPCESRGTESGVACATDSGLCLASSRALWNQPPAQRAAHLPVFCFTVSWGCSLLFHILKI